MHRPCDACPSQRARRHVPVIKLLTEQADAIAASMQEQLLGKLRTHIQLPECLRVIGYLRRLAAFSEQVVMVTHTRVA